MSISFVLLMGLLLILALIFLTLFLANWLGRPAHVGIGNGLHIPPAFSWINEPKQNWTEEKRTILLQNKSKYIIPMDKSGHFVMLFDWKVKFRLDGKEYTLTIPANSTTDFASIPKILQSLISPLSNTVYAAVVHDYLYRDPVESEARSISRADADRIFYWSMMARGVWKITAVAMYLGVRLFGTPSYKREQK